MVQLDGKGIGVPHEVLGSKLSKSCVWNLYVVMYTMYMYIVDILL
jgi:hypothetical protein